MQSPLEGFHSLPNVARSNTSMSDLRGKLYSLSLSQLSRYSEVSTQYHHKPSPFNVRWFHGYNPKPGVINLNEEGSTTAFYAAANCGILYNWTTNQMRILQGHRHVITCIAADAQGQWLVTADSGPENIIIIWDSSDNFPQRTMFSPHGESRIAKVAISADAKYLLTMAYTEKTTLSWWIWSLSIDQPHAKLQVDLPKDSVIAMGFNPYNSWQFLLMTKLDIWIGISCKIFVIERGISKETDDYELKIRKIPKKISPEYGKLTCYTFVEDTCQILVATSRGAVLVYGFTIEYRLNIQATNFEQLRFIKPLRVEDHKINVIIGIDGVIVTGNNAGEIHFYDEQMKLLYWVHDFQVDCVRGISFNVLPRSYQIFDPEYNGVSPALALAVHPEKLDLRDHYKVVIPPKDDSITGDYEVTVPQLSVTCLKYSPSGYWHYSGLHLACGLNTGELLFLDPTTMNIITETPFKDTNFEIQEINYSMDSLTLAFADTGRTVAVYKYNCDTFVWTFIGKHRAHYKDISTVFFLPAKNNGEYKLLSLGTKLEHSPCITTVKYNAIEW
ncbi:putative WD repeat domain 66 [Operophtera brumata]|uniref:Cilia- and flagella-associated protein 251 n=1 Tax=Operophtera brumata TaxID=104452 RepID=A0A0L7KRM7_OPEBR|nr:putative WD repeat domain 66 [Operophtera brumata]